MTFQEMFLHDHTIVLIELVAGIVIALIGIGVVLWGAWVMRQRTVRSSLRATWQQHLTLAVSDLASEHIDEDVIQSAQQQWLYSHGLLKAGMGAGTLLGVVGGFLLLQAMLRVPFGLPPWGLELLPIIPWAWGVICGIALTGAFGFRRDRRIGGDAVLTSGEPSRRVSDYRSPLLVLIVALPVLVYSTVTLIVAPRYVAFAPDVVREYGIVPPPRWILALYPGALLLTVIFAEVCVWIVAKSSAPIRLQNAALAQRFNVGVKRQRMMSIYYLTLIFSAQSVIPGSQLLTSTGHAGEGIYWEIWLWLLLFVTCLVVGMSILLTQGRMGGRLTGWPWGSNRAAAEAREDGAV